MRKFLVCLTILVILFGIHLSSAYLNHKIHQASQYNKTLREIVLTLDSFDFLTAGGGAIGYANYYKWHYAKWRKDPERTPFQKFLFWDKGFFYLADDPPSEYQYPFLGAKN